MGSERGRGISGKDNRGEERGGSELMQSDTGRERGIFGQVDERREGEEKGEGKDVKKRCVLSVSKRK